MRSRTLLLLLTLAAAGAAAAQSSPYDTHPKCTERDADPNAPECVLQQAGEPRQTYPMPRKMTAPALPPKPPMRPAPPPLEFDRPAPAGGSKGS